MDLSRLQVDGAPDGRLNLQRVGGLCEVVAGDGDRFGDRSVETGRTELNGNLPGLSGLNLAVPAPSHGATARGLDVADFQRCVPSVGHDEIMPEHVRGLDFAEVDARFRKLNSRSAGLCRAGRRGLRKSRKGTGNRSYREEHYGNFDKVVHDGP